MRPRTDRQTDARDHNTFRVVYQLTRNLLIYARIVQPENGGLSPPRITSGRSIPCTPCYDAYTEDARASSRRTLKASAPRCGICLQQIPYSGMQEQRGTIDHHRTRRCRTAAAACGAAAETKTNINRYSLGVYASASLRVHQEIAHIYRVCYSDPRQGYRVCTSKVV